MRKTMVTLLVCCLMAGAAPAAESATPEAVQAYCTDLAKITESASEARYLGVPLSLAMQSATTPDARRAIQAAYDEPLAATAEEQKNVGTGLGIIIYVRCRNGGGALSPE